MLATRRTLGLLCWLLATAVVALAVAVSVELTREYGISPNNNLALDLTSGFFTIVLPIGLISGGLTWAGWWLWSRSEGSSRNAKRIGVLLVTGMGVALLSTLLM